MKVLILGASGQLGRSLLRLVPADVDPVALGRAELDITDEAAVERCIESVLPRIVINAAAYTAVDHAETDRARAFAVNGAAVSALARVCARTGARLIHVSTDFVFDGSAGRPYRPDDAPNPLSVYGASKLAGERALQSMEGLDWCIVRTAWLYASRGRNFVLTMLRLFGERDSVRVVADQVGAPTSADSLTRCLWRLTTAESHARILHFTDAGVASWYDFAVAVYEEARALRLATRSVEIMPIATPDYPTPARRPAYSVLDTAATYIHLQMQPMHWRARLRETLQELSP